MSQSQTCCLPELCSNGKLTALRRPRSALTFGPLGLMLRPFAAPDCITTQSGDNMQRGGSRGEQSSDSTSIYDQHLNEMHSVTLAKHWNLFLADAPPYLPNQSGRGQNTLQRHRRLGLGASKPLPTPTLPGD